MRKRGTLWVAVALSALAFTVPVRPVSACSSGQPTFDDVMASTTAVAVVEVDLPPNGEAIPGVAPLRLVRAIHGNPPDLSQRLPTGLCGDAIHYLFGDGATVLVAFGVPYFDQVIHPAWATTETGEASGTAGLPPGVRTMAELEAVIRDRLAPMPVDDAALPLDGTWIVLLLAAVALLTAWRFVSSRPS